MEYNKAFQDVPLSHWVNQALKIMTALHVVEGRSDNRFEPNGQATRAEFIAVLARLLDLPSDGNNYFEDVSSSNWYQNAVNAAYQAGMIRGRTETKFVPNGVITREEVAVILEHAYAYITGKTAVASSVTFGDTSSISEWAKSSVGVVSEQGLMKGINGNKFAPKQFITRAEMVQAMYNLFLKLK
ncbi:S-layer homology domain-containing protein [Cohnella sp. WQ 127256]|uniref:S-layer homology domain-containing protein n=1 Tax=Cohnella sp. WQ 127256 TaxID=2938790 RepID=UPI002117699E|nr:S-layer homology domain-containing protein [Cohnella sp. WQ 127256]